MPDSGGAPDLSGAMTVATDVVGGTRTWSTCLFDQPVGSAVGDLYLVLRFPGDGAPGVGYDLAERSPVHSKDIHRNDRSLSGKLGGLGLRVGHRVQQRSCPGAGHGHRSATLTIVMLAGDPGVDTPRCPRFLDHYAQTRWRLPPQTGLAPPDLSVRMLLSCGRFQRHLEPGRNGPAQRHGEQDGHHVGVRAVSPGLGGR